MDIMFPKHVRLRKMYDSGLFLSYSPRAVINIPQRTKPRVPHSCPAHVVTFNRGALFPDCLVPPPPGDFVIEPNGDFTLLKTSKEWSVTYVLEDDFGCVDYEKIHATINDYTVSNYCGSTLPSNYTQLSTEWLIEKKSGKELTFTAMAKQTVGYDLCYEFFTTDDTVEGQRSSSTDAEKFKIYFVPGKTVYQLTVVFDRNYVTSVQVDLQPETPCDGSQCFLMFDVSGIGATVTISYKWNKDFPKPNIDQVYLDDARVCYAGPKSRGCTDILKDKPTPACTFYPGELKSDVHDLSSQLPAGSSWHLTWSLTFPLGATELCSYTSDSILYVDWYRVENFCGNDVLDFWKSSEYEKLLVEERSSTAMTFYGYHHTTELPRTFRCVPGTITFSEGAVYPDCQNPHRLILNETLTDQQDLVRETLTWWVSFKVYDTFGCADGQAVKGTPHDPTLYCNNSLPIGYVQETDISYEYLLEIKKANNITFYGVNVTTIEYQLCRNILTLSNLADGSWQASVDMYHLNWFIDSQVNGPYNLTIQFDRDYVETLAVQGHTIQNCVGDTCSLDITVSNFGGSDPITFDVTWPSLIATPYVDSIFMDNYRVCGAGVGPSKRCPDLLFDEVDYTCTIYTEEAIKTHQQEINAEELKFRPVWSIEFEIPAGSNCSDEYEYYHASSDIKIQNFCGASSPAHAISSIYPRILKESKNATHISVFTYHTSKLEWRTIGCEPGVIIFNNGFVFPDCFYPSTPFLEYYNETVMEDGTYVRQTVTWEVLFQLEHEFYDGFGCEDHSVLNINPYDSNVYCPNGFPVGYFQNFEHVHDDNVHHQHFGNETLKEIKSGSNFTYQGIATEYIDYEFCRDVITYTVGSGKWDAMMDMWYFHHWFDPRLATQNITIVFDRNYIDEIEILGHTKVNDSCNAGDTCFLKIEVTNFGGSDDFTFTTWWPAPFPTPYVDSIFLDGLHGTYRVCGPGVSLSKGCPSLMLENIDCAFYKESEEEVFFTEEGHEFANTRFHRIWSLKYQLPSNNCSEASYEMYHSTDIRIENFCGNDAPWYYKSSVYRRVLREEKNDTHITFVAYHISEREPLVVATDNCIVGLVIFNQGVFYPNCTFPSTPYLEFFNETVMEDGTYVRQTITWDVRFQLPLDLLDDFICPDHDILFTSPYNSSHYCPNEFPGGYFQHFKHEHDDTHHYHFGNETLREIKTFENITFQGIQTEYIDYQFCRNITTYEVGDGHWNATIDMWHFHHWFDPRLETQNITIVYDRNYIKKVEILGHDIVEDSCSAGDSCFIEFEVGKIENSTNFTFTTWWLDAYPTPWVDSIFLDGIWNTYRVCGPGVSLSKGCPDLPLESKNCTYYPEEDVEVFYTDENHTFPLTRFHLLWSLEYELPSNDCSEDEYAQYHTTDIRIENFCGEYSPFHLKSSVYDRVLLEEKNDTHIQFHAYHTSERVPLIVDTKNCMEGLILFNQGVFYPNCTFTFPPTLMWERDLGNLTLLRKYMVWKIKFNVSDRFTCKNHQLYYHGKYNVSDYCGPSVARGYIQPPNHIVEEIMNGDFVTFLGVYFEAEDIPTTSPSTLGTTTTTVPPPKSKELWWIWWPIIIFLVIMLLGEFIPWAYKMMNVVPKTYKVKKAMRKNRR